jgi:predicted NBD/HSP70 family sugar kinase
MLLGVELGVHGMRAVATSLTGDVIAEASCAHAEARDALTALDAAVRLLREVHERAATPERHLAGMGISVPGTVDESSGCLSGVPALGWGQLAVARLMRERLRGLPLETVPLYVQSAAEVAVAGAREFRGLQSADIAVGAAAFARHRLVVPFKAPARLPALVARYGHRYNAPAATDASAGLRELVAEAVS